MLLWATDISYKCEETHEKLRVQLKLLKTKTLEFCELNDRYQLMIDPVHMSFVLQHKECL